MIPQPFNVHGGALSLCLNKKQAILPTAYCQLPTIIFKHMVASQQHLILNKNQVKQKIKRIAFEIYENNFDEQELIFAGIVNKGYLFAMEVQSEFCKISPVKTILLKVFVDKKALLQSDIKITEDHEKNGNEYAPLINNKSIVLCDDVLNTGRTMAYCLKPFLNAEIKKIQTAVLVDRDHRNFPVSADYVGYSLSTTIKERIEVIMDDKDKFGVYLH